ncbi:MAG: hypothetical protein HYV97_04900 [Bdellovibrio sp.]|nr:hypothetical protein [Bdellovibrio sp.]
MKRLVSVLSICSMLYSGTVLASDCHVGFKMKNGIFTQELKNSTQKELGLKDFAHDQFDMNKLTFSTNRVYDNQGRYQKCDLQKIRYADERFLRIGTAVKKGLVGAGLFTAGVATIYLTLLSLYYDNQPHSTSAKSLDNEKAVIVISTYDHLDPYYYGPIVTRRGYRVSNPYYHHYYMSAYEYHRMRAIEAGLITGTLLIAEAFEVPRNMRSTNFQGPAENNISEEECTVETIKEKLVFDQYLYCGDFDRNAANKFAGKESKIREFVRDVVVDLKKGKFEKVRKNLTLNGQVNSGSDAQLSAFLDRLIQDQSEGIRDIKALDGRSPIEKKQRVEVFVGNQRLEVVCEQDWAYQRNDLYAVGADFIPLNSYSKCAVDSL